MASRFNPPPSPTLRTPLQGLPSEFTHHFHSTAKLIYLNGITARTPCDWCAQPAILALLPFPSCVKVGGGWGGEVEHCANVTYWIGGVEVDGSYFSLPVQDPFYREARLEDAVLGLRLKLLSRQWTADEERALKAEACTGIELLEAVEEWLNGITKYGAADDAQ